MKKNKKQTNTVKKKRFFRLGRELPHGRELAIHPRMLYGTSDSIMADQWKRLNEKVKAKRTKKCGTKDATPRRLKGNELTIQRLSSEVSGKAQKYARVGPREFVSFHADDELTIENIKSACEKHFAPQLGSTLACDVLAGEQGPSCKTVEQIPDLKVIYVRFIARGTLDQSVELNISTRGRQESMSRTRSEGPSRPSKFAKCGGASSNPSKFVPLSLSVADMIKLGKLDTSQTATTVVNMYTFDMELFTWSQIPIIAEFNEEKEPFGKGGFRNAYKATTKHPQFKGTIWVLKRYLPHAVKGIEDIGETVKDHTRKVVQMHLLARNFASQLQHKIIEKHATVFGEVPRYRNIYYGETAEGECVTVEEYISGEFTKYINNNGNLCVAESDTIGQKAQCLTHYSYEKSEKKLMLLDIQGSGYDLFDPEIASEDLFDNSEILYCVRNLSKMAIRNFVAKHKCNVFCEIVGLTDFDS